MVLGLQSWTKLSEKSESEGQWGEKGDSTDLPESPAWGPGLPPADRGDSQEAHEERVIFHTNLLLESKGLLAIMIGLFMLATRRADNQEDQTEVSPPCPVTHSFNQAWFLPCCL